MFLNVCFTVFKYLDYQTIANTLSGAAGRALGSVISKFKSFRNVGFRNVDCRSRQDRLLLAQIRSGTLLLHVETGRFRDTKVENRTCMICNSKEIEDEYHFVSIYKEYDIFRQSLYNKINEKSDIFRNLDNKGKFIFIMKTERKLLSKYLVNAWNKRNSKTYTTK